jgi:hypothetical protein
MTRRLGRVLDGAAAAAGEGTERRRERARGSRRRMFMAEGAATAGLPLPV